MNYYNMLINLTNHPYSSWEETQKEASHKFGECIDLPFPEIDPNADEISIEIITEEYYNKIIDLTNKHNSTPIVHLMGEMTFLYSMANKLREEGIRCIASTSKRNTVDIGDGQKTITFSFVRFRDYYTLNQ